jgi:hypothetical protein
MKKKLTIFFQVVIILIGLSVFIFMLWEPHLEGRNAQATLFQIYFNDLFLAYAYIVSVAFFVALYKIFKLLEYIRHNQVSSLNFFKALRMVKYCSVSLVIFTLAPVVYLFISRPEDDIAGGVVMGLFLVFISAIVASVTIVLEKVLKGYSKI